MGTVSKAITPVVPRYSRALVLGLLAMMTIYAFVELWRPALRVPDELRVAQISREFAHADSRISLTLNGQPFLEHPPTVYWVIGLMQQWFGRTEYAVRLPSAIATLLVLILVGLAARRFAGDTAGLLAPAMIAATAGFTRLARRASPDSWLVLFVTAAYLWHARWIRRSSAIDVANDESSDAPHAKWNSSCSVLPLHLAAAASLAVKGPPGVFLIYGAAIVDVVWHRRWHWWRATGHIRGAIVLIGVAAFWAASVGGALSSTSLSDSLLQNLVWRIFPEPGAYTGGHEHGPLYYIGHMLIYSLPWSLLWPPLIWRALRRRSAGVDDPALRFLIVAPAVGFVLLSIAGTKRPLYLLPLWPVLAIVVSTAIAPRIERRPDGVRHLTKLILSCYGIAILWSLVLGFLPIKYDYRSFVDWLDERTPVHTEVAAYGLGERSRAAVPYYGDRLLVVLSSPSEVHRYIGDPSKRVLIRREALGELEAAGIDLVTLGQYAVGRRHYLLVAAREPEAAGTTSPHPHADPQRD